MKLSDLPERYREQLKYHNRKTQIDGITFDSQREAKRFAELMILLRAGEISDLRLQPQFTLLESYILPNGERVRGLKYTADFSYRQCGNLIVEDAKGHRTREYITKRKLMQDRGITITEV